MYLLAGTPALVHPLQWDGHLQTRTTAESRTEGRRAASARGGNDMMGVYQRILAVDLLEAETEVPKEQIEQYQDYELEAWLYELGFEWDGNRWVNVDDINEFDEA